MIRSSLPFVLLAGATAAAAQPQEPSAPPVPRIVVTALGRVTTPPDRAQIEYRVHGEGATSDEAVGALVARRKAIDAGLARYAGAAQESASDVAVIEVRGRDCNRYGSPHLSTGECAIAGYTADLRVDLRLARPADAGTIVGLVGRLGGTDPRIARFYLADDADAERRATAAALADARRQAEALAAGAGVKLGALLSAGNGGPSFQPADDIVVTAAHIAAPPPPPPPPPIAVEIAPRPIETQARVTVAYRIQP